MYQHLKQAAHVMWWLVDAFKGTKKYNDLGDFLHHYQHDNDDDEDPVQRGQPAGDVCCA